MPTSLSEVSYTFNTEELTKDIDDNVLEDANFAAGEVALEAVKEFMSNRKSPVKGQGRFRALQSEQYKKYKQKRVGNKNPNLELTGNLKDSLYVDSDDYGFTIAVEDDQVEKAYNHQEGETVVKRQFLPYDDGTFKGEILKRIENKLKEYKSGTKKARQVEQEFTQPTPETNSIRFNNLLKEFNKQNAQNQKRVYDITRVNKLTDLIK